MFSSRLSSWSGRSSERGPAPREAGISAAMGMNGLSRSLVREAAASLRLWKILILLSRDSNLWVSGGREERIMGLFLHYELQYRYAYT